MGKKIFRPKKSVAPLGKSPLVQVRDLVGSALDSQKEKLITQVVSAKRQADESVDAFFVRVVKENDREQTTAQKLRKVGRQISNLNKKHLLEQIAPSLEKSNQESNDDLVNRLLGANGNGVSNKKLLKLYRVSQQFKKEFGASREKLVDAILNLRKGPSGKVDTFYKNHLAKKSIATLLTSYSHLKKSAK